MCLMCVQIRCSSSQQEAAQCVCVCVERVDIIAEIPVQTDVGHYNTPIINTTVY